MTTESQNLFDIYINFRCPAHAHENWKGGVERGGGWNLETLLLI